MDGMYGFNNTIQRAEELPAGVFRDWMGRLVSSPWTVSLKASSRSMVLKLSNALARGEIVRVGPVVVQNVGQNVGTNVGSVDVEEAGSVVSKGVD
mmetsp:Transcript_8417/g.17322  ORF Transcript_8417/g.17322 Transcript_8417/m.17322 type:complete len:95 (-) Transcript_8417:770-1054(-)